MCIYINLKLWTPSPVLTIWHRAERPIKKVDRGSCQSASTVDGGSWHCTRVGWHLCRVDHCRHCKLGACCVKCESRRWLRRKGMFKPWVRCVQLACLVTQQLFLLLALHLPQLLLMGCEVIHAELTVCREGPSRTWTAAVQIWRWGVGTEMGAETHLYTSTKPYRQTATFCFLKYRHNRMLKRKTLNHLITAEMLCILCV